MTTRQEHKRIMAMPPYEESYVHELLKTLPKGLTLDQFMERTRPDVHGGWKHEVAEAGRRYFAAGVMPVSRETRR